MSEDAMKKLESGNYSLIPTWERYLRFVPLLGIIYLIFYIGSWTKNEEVTMDNHVNNEERHWSLKELQSEFVPRREYDQLYNLLIKVNTNLETLKKQIN